MSSSPLEIRLFGRLEVRRRDGTAVGESQLRTGKTADLLRILALNNAEPVRVQQLVEWLWPDVGGERAMASLRTAASQIRRTLDDDCVGREPGSLVLRGAWVDVRQFLTDAARAQAAERDGEDRLAHELATSCERLHRGELQAHDERSTWIVVHREHLRQQRLYTLCAGAAAAINLGSHSAARDLAITAIAIERWSETAHRLLMRAYGELGEIGNALQVYESYRAGLAYELGADPSAQTQELHLRLLRGGGTDGGSAAGPRDP